MAPPFCLPHLNLSSTRPDPVPRPSVLANFRAALVAAVAAAMLSGLLLAPATAEEAKTVVCFVSHKTTHGFGAHEYAAGCRLIGQWLEQAYPDSGIEARYSIDWPEDPEAFFRDAATVVFFCTGGGRHLVNNRVADFDRVMRSGAGLACLHYAVEVPVGPSAKGMLAWMGGYFEMNWSVNPHWVAEFEAFPVQPVHPAARGIQPFAIDDEWYFNMRFAEGMEGVTPILSAVAPARTMRRPDGPHSGNPAARASVARGEAQHLAWAYERGEDYRKGRGFGFTGLHYHWNWEDDNFRKAVLNGVAWTARLEIPEEGVDTPRPARAELEANILEHGGEQNRKPAPAAAPAPVAASAKPLFDSGLVTTSTPGHAVAIDVALPDDATELHLVVTDGGNGFSCDWADWMEPRLILADGSEKRLIDLEWKRAEAGWGQARQNQNAAGGPLIVAGEPVPWGIGTHAHSIISYALPAGAKRFLARGGLDQGGTGQQGGSAASVRFLVYDQRGAETPATSGRGRDGGDSRDPADAVASLDVHPELEVQLFASEPMITSPSAIDIDARGRVWVCDVVNYRRNQGKRPEGDRILILEDTDGDAAADRVTVFYQGADVDSAHGICVLGDRVIISAGDEIFSLYDRDGDGKADPGSKEVLFTNIGGAQHDHGIHAVRFGPDGRLYFNFGNTGKRLCDPEGNLIIDIHGVPCTSENNRPYQEGMIFRCDLDGKNVELLAWNFRNNWEVAVDSFGSMWQSDNDDDGNQAVRINWVMEHGNYGYRDEITGAGWREPRVGLEETVPERHWRQNDPGVVPNLLITGAGSPTGITIYEGDLLPEIFRGQMIHCDAGPNVVRSYLTVPDGAGYRVTETVDLVRSTRDRWFRPSGVRVAPDGSLFIADWYDPGVGGHGMGDIEKGRIYRVIPKGKEEARRYAMPRLELREQTGGNIAALLRNPNDAVRYAAFAHGRDVLQGAEEALLAAFRSDPDPRYRARLLWSLGFIHPKLAFAALEDADPDIRITAARVIRRDSQIVSRHSEDVLEMVKILASDSDPRVRREAILALRPIAGEAADRLWATLAAAWDGEDRWYLEALGIAADGSWSERLAAVADLDPRLLEGILWRSRAPETAGRLAALLLAGRGETAPLLRALDFQPAGDALDEAFRKLFVEGEPDTALYAASRLGPGAIDAIEGGPGRLEALLAPVRGTAAFVTLAERLSLTGFPEELAAFVAAHPDAAESVTAARLLLQGSRGPLAVYLRDPDGVPRAAALAAALGKTGDRAVGSLLAGELTRAETAAPLKIAMVNALALNGANGRELLKLAQEGKLDDSLLPVAALAIARSPDARLRAEGAALLPVPQAAGAEEFPSLAELARLPGDASRGEAHFERATCYTCHQVKGKGIAFGPDLSQIGGKLSREALLEAVLYPSAAISHGFHGVSVTRQDGSVLLGYLTGETDAELQLRLPGGVDQSVPRTDVASRQELDLSLMPPGLAAVVGVQGLADLVAWMEGLK